MNKEPRPITKMLADGLRAGGLQNAYNYPGFFSHELFTLLDGQSIQLSEKHTYAEAFGSSLAGHRTAVSFKNVGLNVAADVYLHSVIAGVKGGLVLIVFDDIDVWGSQESQDSRHFMDLYGGLLLEPRDLEEAYSFARDSFSLSETCNMPVVIRITNEHLRMNEQVAKRTVAAKVLEQPLDTKSSLIVHPYYWLDQYEALGRKNDFVKSLSQFNVEPVKTNHKELLLSFGAVDRESLIKTIVHAPDQYDIVEVVQLPLHESVLKLISNPKYQNIHVLEYGQPYVWEKISAHTLIPVHSVTPPIQDKARQFELWERDGNLFEAIHSLKKQGSDKLFVVSDITRSTVEKHEVVDAALSYGSALSVSNGYARAKSSREGIICITGDGAISHEGLDTINYANANNIDLTLIIVDNGGLWCTGGQAPAVQVEEYLVHNNLPYQSVQIDFDTPTQIRYILESIFQQKGFSILLAKTEMGPFRGE